jgi:acylaminoacyl-peptidase
MLIILALQALSAAETVNPALSNRLEMLDVFNLEYVSDPQISPDGERIVYVRHFSDVMTDQQHSNLWLTDFAGKQHRPLTTGNYSDGSPVWSHDGTRLLFRSNRSGNSQLHLLWLQSRESMQLTNTAHAPGGASWSHDDEHIAFSMFVPGKPDSVVKMPPKPEGAEWNKPPIYIDDLNYRRDGAGYLPQGKRQLFVLPVTGGTPRQLTDADFNHGAAAWSVDNKALLFAANHHEDGEYNPLNSEIHRLDLHTGVTSTLTDRDGPDSSPTVSPDGKWIAYLGFDDRFLGYQNSGLYLMRADGSNQRLLSGDFARDINNIQWDGRSRGLYFQYTDQGHDHIGYFELNGSFSKVTGGLGGLSLGRPYNASSFSVADNGRYAFTAGDATHPADLAAGSKGKDQRLTRVNDDLFKHKQLGAVEEIRFQSAHDGLDLQGWVITPPDFDPAQKYPMILEIHGGPFASYGDVFSTELQLFAAAGYVVLYMNPRGSAGYGEAFGNYIDKNYPSEDYDDLMTGVDTLLERGFVDPEQLFVTGGSGGGVLSAWIIGKTDRFAGAVVAKPVINWTSWLLTADLPAFAANYWFEQLPWEDPETYQRYSPLSLVGKVKTPTMLLTGEADYRTPISESEQYYTALKLARVESALVRIPGASHGIANRPSNLVAKVAAILSWFQRYRSDADASASSVVAGAES